MMLGRSADKYGRDLMLNGRDDVEEWLWYDIVHRHADVSSIKEYGNPSMASNIGMHAAVPS